MALFHFPFTRKLGLLVLGSLLLLEGNIRSHGILNTTRPNLEVSLEFELANNEVYSSNNSTLSPPPNLITPCTDFYTYACSEWHRQAEATNKLTANRTLRDRSDAFTQKTMLEAFRNKKGSSGPAALNSSSSAAVRLLVGLHEQCLELLSTKSYREVFYETLYRDLHLLHGRNRTEVVYLSEQSPFLAAEIEDENEEAGNDNNNLNSTTFSTLFINFYSMTGEGLIFDLDTIIDLANRNTVRLAVSQNELLPALVPVFLDSYASDQNNSAIQELLALHRKLSEDSEEEDSPGSASSSSERMVELLEEQANLTLGELNAQTGLNWTEVVNRVLLKNKSQNSSVQIQLYSDSDRVYAELEYVKAALKVLQSTPTRVVENYASLTYMAFLSTTLVDGCLLEESTNVAQMVSYISSRLYVDGFVRRTSRRQVEGILKNIDQMITYLRRAFFTTINDDGVGGSDDAALQQLYEMKYSIGFSDWFMDDRKLDRYYELVDKDGHPSSDDVSLVPGDYMASLRSFLRHLIVVNLGSRKAPSSEESWGFPISIANAWNNPITNHIYIPLGHLTPAIFNQSSPLSTQYGVLGFTLGHEIAHCFTAEKAIGRKVRSTKTSLKSSTNSTSFTSSFSTYRIFAAHRRCFEQQYSQTVESNGRRANGTRMLHENFADNLGLRAAYDAYQLAAAEAVFPFTLRQSRSYSSSSSADHLKKMEKINGSGRDFFTAYAQQFCVKMSAEEEEMLALMEASSTANRVHASHRHRVNVPLSNFAPFAAAFNCPLGSPMHPKKRCAFS